MDIFAKLFILALVSLHQYVPREQMAEKYFESTVDPQSLQLQVESQVLLAAAHQTCRYFFVTGQKDLQVDEQGLVNFIFTMADEKSTTLETYGTSSTAFKKVVRDICRTDFDLSIFSNAQILELNQFLQNEIAILNQTDLAGFGEMGLFGQTTLYDRHGSHMGGLNSNMGRWQSLPQISALVPKALIAAEDKSFFKHQGVDLSSMVRIMSQFRSSSDDSVSGGSTLTMQILKNFYFKDKEFNDSQTVASPKLVQLLRKVREWFWAKPFENHLSQNSDLANGKNKILEYYLNLMDFGPGIRGISQAATVFFSKTPDKLTLSEAAFIATLFKAPQRYSSPANYERYTDTRRKYVLTEMVDLKWEESLLTPISATEKKQALLEPLPQWSRIQNTSTPTEYIYLQNISRDFIKQVTRGNPNVLPVELEIISSVDSNLQHTVYEIVRKKLDEYDSSRYSLSRIGPARDDRSNIASLKSEDVQGEVESLIREYIRMAGKKLDAIILVKKNADVEKSEYYFSTQNKALRTSTQLVDLKDKLPQTSLVEGTVVFIDTQATDCESNTIEQTISDVLQIPQPCYKIVEDDGTRAVQEQVRKSIIQRLLQRMSLAASRTFIKAAYLDPITKELLVYDTNLEGISDLKTIALSTNHREKNHSKFFSDKSRNGHFKPGQIFWVAQKENSDSYYLETPKLQASVVVMDSHSGEVFAHFGGYAPENSRYFDRSRQALRQPGSTLKPWLYYLALNKGFTADSVIQNNGVAFVIDKNSVYRPDNYSSESGGANVPLDQAFRNSYNKAAVGLLTNPFFGPDPKENLNEFVNFLTTIGVYDSESVLVNPSIVLGSQEVTLLNLTSSFTFFANGQKIVHPTFFHSVKTGQGVSLYDDANPVTTEVPFTQNRFAVDGIQRLMIDVANYGTASALLNFPIQKLRLAQCDGRPFGINGQVCFGGKTGTSSSLNDNWFMGISKNFVIGVWVGYDYRESTGSTGGKLALPIFMDIVEQGQGLLPPIEPLIAN